MTWASKTDATGDQADIAKNIEKHRFSLVWEDWRVILEAWRSFGLSCWQPGWQLPGWLEDWLAVAGAGWKSGWPQGFLELREPGGGVVNHWSGGPRTTTFIKKPITITTVD